MAHILTKILLGFAKLMVAAGIFPNLFRSWLAAGAVSEGRDAFNHRDFVQALKILRPIADYEIEDSYVARAQYIVGLIYRDGLAGEKNVAVARAYLERARSLGSEESEQALSILDRKRSGPE